MVENDAFNARGVLETASGPVDMYRLDRLEEAGLTRISKLPYSIRILLENMLRNAGGSIVSEDDVKALAAWSPQSDKSREIAFNPSRVVLQDFTGVPAVVDLAAMRSAMDRLGGDPQDINPQVPVDLVIDHSVQVDSFGHAGAYVFNVEREYERNGERYALLRWARKAFDDFRVVPPGTGIIHQVNLEYLAPVVHRDESGERALAYPDTLVGTDSHTTMINALGVMGWGVGGIEAEAVICGQPYGMLVPDVVGFRLTGQLPDGATATDLVLTVTERLREHGVVNKFVEFFGPGLDHLTLPDRATIANMSPEYGATMGFFPVDDQTLTYLRGTGRDPEQVDLVERYLKEQGMFRTPSSPEPTYSATLELDMNTVQPSVAGPSLPHDRLGLSEVSDSIRQVFRDYDRPLPDSTGGESAGTGGGTAVQTKPKQELTDGSVVYAAITSCTNTSNPSVMVGAGLLAKNAVEAGLEVKPWVKTSLAPGSKVVTEYLKKAELMPYLEALDYHIVGYGCTTCIGNSGPLPEEVEEKVLSEDLVVASVLSGNRNFGGRISPHVKANYLASPPLVIAYALAGTVDIDIERDPLGENEDGEPVYLSDIWPSQEQILKTVEEAIDPDMFRDKYADVFKGDENWENLPVPEGELYEWDNESTYIQEPPFFIDMPLDVPETRDIKGASALALLGDSVTTDHISPAGTILKDSPAGQYLIEHGVKPSQFNSFGSRRGNHEVMMRGTFGNVRLRNQLVPGVEGGYTVYLPAGEQTTIYEAAMQYIEDDTPLVVIAGTQYGTGSSRDWAAKGTLLLGVKAVLATSYERIHRNNLIGMGVLPLQFKEGENAKSFGLDGTEVYDISGVAGQLTPGQTVEVTAAREDGNSRRFDAVVRLDSSLEVTYYRHGGILQTVLRQLLKEETQA